MFGDNDSGKTAIIKILHACQQWLHNDYEGFNRDAWLSKNSLLVEQYEEIKKKLGQQRYREREVNLLEERDFFHEKLEKMIKSQVRYVTKYFKNNNEEEQDTWKKLITKKKRTELHGKNRFF